LRYNTIDVHVLDYSQSLSVFDRLEWERRKLRNKPISVKNHMAFSMISMLEIPLPGAIIDSIITGDTAMANLLVRNVDDSLVQSLRELAAAHGRSAEAEHREILAKALRKTRRKSFVEVLAGIPNVGADSDFARVDDGEASRVFG
jgi:antitoxin FitA